MTDFFVM